MASAPHRFSRHHRLSRAQAAEMARLALVAAQRSLSANPPPRANRPPLPQPVRRPSHNALPPRGWHGFDPGVELWIIAAALLLCTVGLMVHGLQF